MVLTRVTLGGSTPVDVVVFGTVIHGISPQATSGRNPLRSGELVADTKLGVGIRPTITVAGRRFRVVGTYTGLTVFGGQPTAVMPIQDARAISFNRLPLATSIMTHGVPATAPVGYKVQSPAQAAGDLRRPLKSAASTIAFLNILLWVIAAGIIGSIVYLTVIERQRDFAVLKATGFGSLRTVREPGDRSGGHRRRRGRRRHGHGDRAARLPRAGRRDLDGAYVGLVGVSIVVGVLASLVGLRRAVGVDPALAFG